MHDIVYLLAPSHCCTSPGLLFLEDSRVDGACLCGKKRGVPHEVTNLFFTFSISPAVEIWTSYL